MQKFIEVLLTTGSVGLGLGIITFALGYAFKRLIVDHIKSIAERNHKHTLDEALEKAKKQFNKELEKYKREQAEKLEVYKS